MYAEYPTTINFPYLITLIPTIYSVYQLEYCIGKLVSIWSVLLSLHCKFETCVFKSPPGSKKQLSETNLGDYSVTTDRSYV